MLGHGLSGGYSSLRPLAGLPKLSKLSISLGPYDDFPALAQLPIQEVDAFLVEDLDYRRLPDMRKLRKLTVRQVEPEQLEHIGKASQLVELSLEDTRLNDLSVLSQLSHLRKLSLSGNIRSTAGLEVLPRLEELTLAGSVIEVDITSLNGAPMLKKLTLKSTNTRPTTLGAFRRARPACDVIVTE